MAIYSFWKNKSIGQHFEEALYNVRGSAVCPFAVRVQGGLAYRTSVWKNHVCFDFLVSILLFSSF